MKVFFPATVVLAAVLLGCHPEPAGETARGDSPVFMSSLQQAISRGMKPGGDIAKELSGLDDCTVRSRSDARAVCEALATLPLARPNQSWRKSALWKLATLFQSVEHGGAVKVLLERGIPHLIRIFDALVDDADEVQADNLLFVLKILATYGSRDGAERIVAAARRPLLPEAYMWHMILSPFSEDHPHGTYVFAALSDPLPQGFLAVALLDAANEAALEDNLRDHPFDSPAGKERLRSYLEDDNPEFFSYAHSATVALPFVSNPDRDPLLDIAMDHADPRVKMEAGWAAGKLGREAGLEVLTRFCRDPNHSAMAQRYLDELGRNDLIPESARSPSFRAKAEFAEWLAHPNELGRPPDELEIVDHRVLAWPPGGERKPVWLIKYRLRDETGLQDDDVDCGMVGTMTFCFFSDRMHQRPPEDVYAIHCYRELEQENLIEEREVNDQARYSGMLDQWRGAPLQGVTITHVAELSHRLNRPRRLVALASAILDGQDGWAVLDGAKSEWYPVSDMPESTSGTTPLEIHVGWTLLGFEGPVDRKKFLLEKRPPRDPRQIIKAYEKFMAEARSAAPERQKKLLGSWSLLSQHFDSYVAALVSTGNAAKPDTLMAVYERFLELARNADESIREEVYDSFGVLGEHFEAYTDALQAAGRTADIGPLLTLFAPFQDSNLGHSRLGGVAFKAGLLDVAEEHLATVRKNSENHHRGADMSRLAEIWHGRGKRDDARELLLDCLRKLLADFRESNYRSDRETFHKDMQLHRETYMRLFPGEEAGLKALAIPPSRE